jgi:hypothetical protein
MTRTRKVLFLLLAVIAIVVLLWILFSRPRPFPTQTGQLSNGAAITLNKITFGTKHQCFLGTPKWHETFIHMLPIRYQQKLGYGNSGFQFESSGGDTIGIWLVTPVTVPRLRLVTASLYGHETVQLNFRTTKLQMAQMLSSWKLTGWELVDFPRRERDFTLRVEEYLTNDAWKTVLECRIVNPGSTNQPVWTPPAFPTTQQAAGLTFALTNLTTYIGTNGPRTKAVFLVTSNSLPVTGWVIKSVDITDATGNKLWQGRTDIYSGEGKIIYDCIGQLDPHETAWKFHVDFESYDDHPMNHPPGAPPFVPIKLTLDFIAKPTATALSSPPLSSKQ